MKVILIILILLFLLINYYSYIKKENYKNYEKVLVTPSVYIKNIPEFIHKSSLIENYIFTKLSSLHPLKKTINNNPNQILNTINNQKNILCLVSNYDYENFIKLKNNINITLICDLFYTIFSIISPNNRNIDSFVDLKNKNIIIEFNNNAEYYILEKFQDIFEYNIIVLNKTIEIKSLPEIFQDLSYHAYCKFIFYPNSELNNLYKNWRFKIFGIKGIDKKILGSLLPNYKKILFDKSLIYNETSIGESIQNNLNIYTNNQSDNKLTYRIIKSIYTNFTYIKNTNKTEIKNVIRTFNHYNLIDISNAKKKLHSGVKEYYNHKGYITLNSEPICGYFVGKSKCDTAFKLNPYRLIM